MTNDRTDKDAAICPKRAELETLEQELEIIGVSLETFIMTTPTVAVIAVEDSSQNTAGTSLLSKNADDNTTTITIETEVTKTDVQTLLSNKRYTSLESVLNKESKCIYTTQLFVKLPEDYHKDLTNLILKKMKIYPIPIQISKSGQIKQNNKKKK